MQNIEVMLQIKQMSNYTAKSNLTNKKKGDPKIVPVLLLNISRMYRTKLFKMQKNVLTTFLTDIKKPTNLQEENKRFKRTHFESDDNRDRLGGVGLLTPSKLLPSRVL